MVNKLELMTIESIHGDDLPNQSFGFDDYIPSPI